MDKTFEAEDSNLSNCVGYAYYALGLHKEETGIELGSFKDILQDFNMWMAKI